MIVSLYRIAIAVCGATLFLATSIGAYLLYYVVLMPTMGLSDLPALIILTLSLSLATATATVVTFIRFCHRTHCRSTMVISVFVGSFMALSAAVAANMVYFEGTIGLAWAVGWVFSGRAFVG